MDYWEILRAAHDKALAEHPDLDPRVKKKSKAQLAEAKKKADQAKRLASLNVKSAHTQSMTAARRSGLMAGEAMTEIMGEVFNYMNPGR